MCFGSSPKAPEIVYKGPSQKEIDANQKALDDYAAQTAASNKAFMDNMQAQIDKSNAEMASLQSQYDAEAKAAAAAASAVQNEAYATTASITEAPEGAQTTEPIKKKQREKTTLKIARNSLPSSAGTGLNIGV